MVLLAVNVINQKRQQQQQQQRQRLQWPTNAIRLATASHHILHTMYCTDKTYVCVSFHSLAHSLARLL